MRHTKRFTPALLLLTVLALIALGCGSDDKGTNASDLTPEEQLELIRAFDLDTNTAGPALLQMALLPVSSGYLDGISEDDFNPFDYLGAFMTSMKFTGIDHRVQESARRYAASVPADFRLSDRIASILEDADADADSFFISYDETGWWRVYVSVDLDTVMQDGTLEGTVVFRDSLRFLSSSGQPMVQPTEETDGFNHGFDVSVSMQMSASDQQTGQFDVGVNLGMSGFADLDGLLGATTTISSNSAIDANDIDVVFSFQDNQGLHTLRIAGDVGMDGSAANLQFPTAELMAGNACPTTGLLNSSAAIDLSVTADAQSETARGTWNVAVDITSPGLADIEISSGNFQIGATNKEICD
jgi:hypothetical protein